MPNTVSRLIAALSFAIVSGAASAAPQVGDKAPPVKVTKWMTQTPPSTPGEAGADKNVFLVEFWATWCGPCMKSIPHLAELHKKYQKDGLVIMGLSNEEPEIIAKFLGERLKKLRIEMPYFIGADEEMETQNVWMKDIEGIPYAFLVDRKSMVVWTGNPLADTKELDDAIKNVLAGQFDINAAKKAAENAKKADDLMNDLRAAFGLSDKAKVFKLLDEIIALKPKDLQAYLIKRQMFIEFEMEDQIAGWEARIEEAMKDSPDSLLQLADVELGKPISKRNLGLLYRSIVRANELHMGKDAETLALLAQVQCNMGMLDAAIATQRQANALATGEMAEEFKLVLKYYETSKELGKTAMKTQ